MSNQFSTKTTAEKTRPGPSPSDRDSNGRFTKGNKSGIGNPFAANVAQLRKAALEVVTPQEMQGVFRVLLLKAQTGDLACMKLLFAYTLGKPATAVDPDEVDAEQPATQAEMPAVAVPERQAVAERLQDFIHQAASALPNASWQALVSGVATIAETVLHKASQSGSEDPQPRSADSLPEEIQAEPEQAETPSSAAVKQTSVGKAPPAQPGHENEAERPQASEQMQKPGMHQTSPGNAQGSGTTRHSQHTRLVDRQEATVDDERGMSPAESDTAQANGKCGSGETGQTKCAEDAMVVPAVRQGTVNTGSQQRSSVVG